MIRDLLKKVLFLLLCVVGSANGAWAFTASITDEESLDAAMEKLKTTTDEWIDLRFDADVALSEDIRFETSKMSNYVKMVALDLNGHKLTVDGIIMDGTGHGSTLPRFILKDSQYQAVAFSPIAISVDNNNKGCLVLTNGITVKGGALFLFESGVIDGESCDVPAIGVIGDETGSSSIGSAAYINNGYIKGKDGCAVVYGLGATVYVDGTKQMRYYNGEYLGKTNGNPVLTCLDNAPIAGNGTNNGTMNCGGTNITVGQSIVIGNITTAGYVACGIYHPQKGSLTIKDGARIYANGGVGVLMRGGTLNMTGGDIEASGDNDLTGKVGDSRVVVPTSGIVFDDYAGYYDHSNVSVAVSGGTVTGSHSAVDVVKGETSATPKKQVTLSGGKYSSDIAVFAAEGYGAKSTTGGYTLDTEVATVESEVTPVAHYATLNDAFNATTDGCTVKLLQDITQDNCSVGKNDADKTVTLDLNGKTLSIPETGTTKFNVYCNLTIKDSQEGGKINDNSYPIFYLLSDENALIIDGGIFEGGVLVYGNANINYKNSITINGGYFNLTSTYSFLTNVSTDAFPVKIRKAYFAKDYKDITSYLDDNYKKVDSDVDGYAIMTKFMPIELTYGTTAQNLDTDNNAVTIDLKDDATDASERLSKVQIKTDVENMDVTLQKNFATANVWNSFYVPFDITATSELLDKFDIAKIWDTELYWNNGTPETNIEFIQLNEGDKIAAFTPCLIRAKEAGKQDMTFNGVTLYKNATKSIDCSTVEQTFTFTGVLANTSIYGYYAVNADGQLVQATNTAAQVSPFKFYMGIENKNGSTAQKSKAYRIRVIGDDTTGISDINATKTQHDNTVYNLQGVAAGTTTAGPPSGIYIQNGRKVIVK